MKTPFYYSLLTIIIVLLGLADANSQGWEKVYYDYQIGAGFKTVITEDNNYLIFGSIYNGGNDFFLLKVDSTNNEMWSNSYGGTGSETAFSISPVPAGGYVLVGHTSSFGAGGTDAFIVRVDENGDTLWTNTMGGAGNDHGRSISPTSNGGFIFAGGTTSFDTSHIYIGRIDSLGVKVWEKAHGKYNWADVGTSVLQTQDGNFVVGGKLQTTSERVYLIKLDQNGDTLWTKEYDEPKSQKERCNALIQLSDGGFVLLAQIFYSSQFNIFDKWDLWVIRTDALGDTIWTKVYGGLDNETGYDIIETCTGSFVITGGINLPGGGPYSDVFLMEISASGDSLWTQTWDAGYHEIGHSVRQTSDGGFIIGASADSSGVGHFYLIKTDADNMCNVVPVGVMNGYNQESIVAKVYPNPNTGLFTLEMDLQEKTHLRIKLYYFTGQLVLSENIGRVTGNYTKQIDLSGYAKGIYYVQILTEKGVVTSKVVYQ